MFSIFQNLILFHLCSVFDIDDQHVDEEMETSISEDLEDGILPINISSGEEDIPLPIVQVLLKLNEDVCSIIILV